MFFIRAVVPTFLYFLEYVHPIVCITPMNTEGALFFPTKIGLQVDSLKFNNNNYIIIATNLINIVLNRQFSQH